MQPMAPIAHLFRFNRHLLHLAVDGFDAADWTWHPERGGNPAFWIVGHVTLYRKRLAGLVGGAWPGGEVGDAYAKGSKPGAALPDDPAPATLVEWFAAATDPIAAAVERMTPEEAARDAGMKMPDGSTTVGGIVGFIYAHETQHLGQLVYVRRARGRPGFA